MYNTTGFSSNPWSTNMFSNSRVSGISSSLNFNQFSSYRPSTTPVGSPLTSIYAPSGLNSRSKCIACR